MSVRHRPGVLRWSGYRRVPQLLKLPFKGTGIHTMPECFRAVYQNDGDLRAIGGAEFSVAVYVCDRYFQRVLSRKWINHGLGLIAEMAARTRIDFNSNGFGHPILPATVGKIAWPGVHHARSARAKVQASRNAVHPALVSGTEAWICRSSPERSHSAQTSRWSGSPR